METADTCATTLRESILRGAFPPGVRLPTERALAERFGVNRATVRTALGRLEAEHLVTARQGSGYTVHDFRREAGPDLIATLATLATTELEREAIVRDLLLVRRMLARGVLARLAEMAGRTGDLAAGLARVEAAIAAFEEVAHARAVSPADLARADLDVAAALVAATGSTVLALCMNPVASLLARLPQLQQAMYRDPASNALAYRAVVAWARTGAAEGLELIVAELAARDEATLAALAKPKKALSKEAAAASPKPKKTRAR
jgi:GntR family transcriptional regulator, transcriptional repressor for pyruvate dehydrogenase complex